MAIFKKNYINIFQSKFKPYLIILFFLISLLLLISCSPAKNNIEQNKIYLHLYGKINPDIEMVLKVDFEATPNSLRCKSLSASDGKWVPERESMEHFLKSKNTNYSIVTPLFFTEKTCCIWNLRQFKIKFNYTAAKISGSSIWVIFKEPNKKYEYSFAIENKIDIICTKQKRKKYDIKTGKELLEDVIMCLDSNKVKEEFTYYLSDIPQDTLKLNLNIKLCE